MSENDPVTWKIIAGAAFTALAAPVIFIWNKVIGAASKEELTEIIRRVDKNHEVLSDKVSAVRSDINDMKIDFIDRLNTHMSEENHRLDILIARSLEKNHGD